METSKYPPYDSEYVEACCNYAANLRSQQLPVLFDGAHVRSVLNFQQLHVLSYHEFHIPKHDGVRRIVAPSRSLKKRQSWIYENILSSKPVSDYAHGFVPGRSILTNAQQHVGQQYAFCMDIKDFFPSISQEKVATVFRDMGYTPSAANQLAEICCYHNALPQGAPTSPYLSNLICCKMDEELQQLALQKGCVFSRYADDITFSSNQDMRAIVPSVVAVMKKYGFHLN